MSHATRTLVHNQPEQPGRVCDRVMFHSRCLIYSPNFSTFHAPCWLPGPQRNISWSTMDGTSGVLQAGLPCTGSGRLFDRVAYTPTGSPPQGRPGYQGLSHGRQPRCTLSAGCTAWRTIQHAPPSCYNTTQHTRSVTSLCRPYLDPVCRTWSQPIIARPAAWDPSCSLHASVVATPLDFKAHRGRADQALGLRARRGSADQALDLRAHRGKADVTLVCDSRMAQVLTRTHVRMIVWERGAGRTLACGTGACAVVVAGGWLGAQLGHPQTGISATSTKPQSRAPSYVMWGRVSCVCGGHAAHQQHGERRSTVTCARSRSWSERHSRCVAPVRVGFACAHGAG